MYAVNGPGLGNTVKGITLDMDGNVLEAWNADQVIITIIFITRVCV